MSLRCNAFVTVMKTAELRDCDDPVDTRDRPREWTLLVEPQMGPVQCIVIRLPGAAPDSPPRWLILQLERCSAPFPFERVMVDRDNNSAHGENAEDEKSDGCVGEGWIG